MQVYVELHGWAESAAAGSRDALGWAVDDHCRGWKWENQGAYDQNCSFDGKWGRSIPDFGADFYQQGSKGDEGEDREDVGQPGIQ